jgi:hypothetical protein
VTSYTPADPDNPKVLGFDDPLVDQIGKIDRVSSTNDPDAGFVFKVSSFSSLHTGTGAWELPIPHGTPLPGTGMIEGDSFVLDDDGHHYYYNGTDWLDLTGSGGGGGGSSTLTDSHIFIGDSSNLEADVAMSGDASIDNTGAVTVLAVQGNAFAATAPNAGDVPTWNSGTSQYEPAAPAGGSGGADATSIQGVNVSSTAPADGDTLKYNSGTNQYEPGAGGGGGLTFAGCRTAATTAQSFANNTVTVVDFDSELYDTDSFHSNSTNNSRITIPTGKSGYYSVKAYLRFDTGAGGTHVVWIRLNGSSGPILNTADVYNPNSTSCTANITCDVYLSATDYIELCVYHNVGSTLTHVTSSSPFLSVQQIG